MVEGIIESFVVFIRYRQFSNLLILPYILDFYSTYFGGIKFASLSHLLPNLGCAKSGSGWKFGYPNNFGLGISDPMADRIISG